MSAAAPALGELYTSATRSLLAALPRALSAPPLELLGWTATLYVRPYLTAAEHRTAMQAALERARAEAAGWPQLPHDEDIVAQHMPLLAADRPALYRLIWRRAVAGGTAAHLLLAQHACEIAELLDQAALPAALRLGMLLPLAGPTALPNRPDGSRPDLALPEPHGDPIERLSRALLARAIGAHAFVDRLLAVHAGNRGTELTGGWEAPRSLAAQLGAELAGCDRSPKRLRAVQPHELVRRAVLSGSARATLAVEAGLAEAEGLANGRRLLLLAALDRAITPNEKDHARY